MTRFSSRTMPSTVRHEASSTPATLRTIPLRILFWRGLRALRHPFLAFREIRPNEQVPFQRLLWAMAAWGAVYALLHFRAIERHWLWQELPGIGRCRLLAFVLTAPAGWLFGSVGLWCCARWLDRPLTREQAEVAACYLWLVWALMPLVDILHWFGWPVRPLLLHLPGGVRVPFVAHASWAWAFPYLLLQLTAFFLHQLQGRRHRLLQSAGLSLGILVAARGVWEPLYGLVCVASGRLFPEQFLGDWWLVMVDSAIMVVVGVAWRWVLRGGSVWKAAAIGTVSSAVIILAAWPLRYALYP